MCVASPRVRLLSGQASMARCLINIESLNTDRPTQQPKTTPHYYHGQHRILSQLPRLLPTMSPQNRSVGSDSSRSSTVHVNQSSIHTFFTDRGTQIKIVAKGESGHLQLLHGTSSGLTRFGVGDNGGDELFVHCENDISHWVNYRHVVPIFDDFDNKNKKSQDG